jgi:hypothetical protein
MFFSPRELHWHGMFLQDLTTPEEFVAKAPRIHLPAAVPGYLPRSHADLDWDNDADDTDSNVEIDGSLDLYLDIDWDSQWYYVNGIAGMDADYVYSPHGPYTFYLDSDTNHYQYRDMNDPLYDPRIQVAFRFIFKCVDNCPEQPQKAQYIIVTEEYCDKGAMGLPTFIGAMFFLQLAFYAFKCGTLKKNSPDPSKRQYLLLILSIMALLVGCVYLMVNPFDCHLLWTRFSDTFTFSFFVALALFASVMVVESAYQAVWSGDFYRDPESFGKFMSVRFLLGLILFVTPAVWLAYDEPMPSNDFRLYALISFYWIPSGLTLLAAATHMRKKESLQGSGPSAPQLQLSGLIMAGVCFMYICFSIFTDGLQAEQAVFVPLRILAFIVFQTVLLVNNLHYCCKRKRSKVSSDGQGGAQAYEAAPAQPTPAQDSTTLPNAVKIPEVSP